MSITDTWPSLALEANGPPMVGTDLEGRTVLWSAAAEALFGWSARDVIGRAPPAIPEALRQEWQLQVRRVIASGEGTAAAETQRMTRDGRTIWVVHSASPVRASDGRIIGVLDTLLDITALKLIDEESRALAQVRERELIAMDLHDGLVQSLYALVLNLSAVDEPASALRATRTEIERLIEETREYLFNLKVREFSPRNLGAALGVLADGLRLNTALDVHLSVDPSLESFLAADARGHVLFLVREAVSNVLRHAHASRVDIMLSTPPEAIVIRVADNGRGFDVTAMRTARPRGLGNMAERARLIGGRLTITSRPGKGTTVTVEVPRA